MSQESGNGVNSSSSQDGRRNARNEQTTYMSSSSSAAASASEGRRYLDSQEYMDDSTSYLESGRQSCGPEDQYITWSPARNRAHQVMDSPLLSPSRRGVDSPERDQRLPGAAHSPGTPTRKENGGYWDNMSPRKALYSPAALSAQFLPEDDKSNEEAMDLYSPGQHILHILSNGETENSQQKKLFRHKVSQQNDSHPRYRTRTTRQRPHRSSSASASSQRHPTSNGNQTSISDGMLPAPHAGSTEARNTATHRRTASNPSTKDFYNDEEAAKMLISLSPQREIPNHENLLDSARSDYSAKGGPDSPLLERTQHLLDFDDEDEENKSATEDVQAPSATSTALRPIKNSTQKCATKSSTECDEIEPETPRDLSPLHTEVPQYASKFLQSSKQTATTKGKDANATVSSKSKTKQQQNGTSTSATVTTKREKGVVPGTGSLTVKATYKPASTQQTDSTGSSKVVRKKGRPTKYENSVSDTPSGGKSEDSAKSGNTAVLKTPPRQVKRTTTNSRSNSKGNSEATSSEDSSTTRKVSPYLGVSWIRASQRWRADSVIKGKLKYLGCFRTEEEAACAVDDARSGSWDGTRKLRLNFPDRQSKIPNSQKIAAIKNVDGEGNKKSDFIGVVWDAKQGQWRARICVPDEKWIVASYHNRTSGSPTSGHVELRHFNSELEAAKAVDQAKFDTYSRILNMAENDNDRAKVPKPRLNFPDEFGLRQPGRSARSKAQRRIAKFSSASPGRNSDSMSTSSYESSPSMGLRSPERMDDISPIVSKTSKRQAATEASKTLQRRDSTDGADANSSIISPAANPSPAKRRRKRKNAAETASASSS
eukprot:gb/GECG01010697.1/.p1 GENE.gb/GECG01010697.1/~~gb/GECG01010697.1/.p1  ORF type:complete len:826 (+),score=131.92 gb/GECG01010697.1/:1-2478(+)